MQAIEPPIPDPDRRPDLELRARRVVSYSPWFIWTWLLFWIAFLAVQLYVTNWDWLSALRFAGPGVLIGAVLGIRFRDS